MNSSWLPCGTNSLFLCKLRYQYLCQGAAAQIQVLPLWYHCLFKNPLITCVTTTQTALAINCTTPLMENGIYTTIMEITYFLVMYSCYYRLYDMHKIYIATSWSCTTFQHSPPFKQIKAGTNCTIYIASYMTSCCPIWKRSLMLHSDGHMCMHDWAGHAHVRHAFSSSYSSRQVLTTPCVHGWRLASKELRIQFRIHDNNNIAIKAYSCMVTGT